MIYKHCYTINAIPTILYKLSYNNCVIQPLHIFYSLEYDEQADINLLINSSLLKF